MEGEPGALRAAVYPPPENSLAMIFHRHPWSPGPVPGHSAAPPPQGCPGQKGLSASPLYSALLTASASHMRDDRLADWQNYLNQAE